MLKQSEAGTPGRDCHQQAMEEVDDTKAFQGFSVSYKYVYDFEGVHENMEDPMGLKDKSLNLQ